MVLRLRFYFSLSIWYGLLASSHVISTGERDSFGHQGESSTRQHTSPYKTRLQKFQKALSSRLR